MRSRLLAIQVNSNWHISYTKKNQIKSEAETLGKVLQQGLKEEHMQYKDKVVELFTNMKDRIKVEDLRVY